MIVVFRLRGVVEKDLDRGGMYNSMRRLPNLKNNFKAFKIPRALWVVKSEPKRSLSGQ